MAITALLAMTISDEEVEKMMISPEAFYEEEVKGKSRDEIETLVRELEEEISELKKEIDNPQRIKIMPTPETMLSVTKEYLKKAKEALESL